LEDSELHIAVKVVLLQESPSSALPGPNILVTATEASLASFPVNYLSQKKDDFVSSMRSALGSIQGSLSANSGTYCLQQSTFLCTHADAHFF